MHTKELAAGDRLGRYVLEREVARGGMGVLFLARDPELHRQVAVKIIRPASTSSDKARGRMIREARALAALAHPNVVSIFDVDEHEGIVFFVMEFVAGYTLRAWLAERRHSWSKVLSIFSKAGAGLAAVHGAGLVHRDFKPDNVLVGADGRVLIADFGLAMELEEAAAPGDEASVSEEAAPGRPAASTWALGTPGYIAPEQYRAEPADARTDQFSFCAALYEALSGQGPFRGETPADIREATLKGEVAPPGSPGSTPGGLYRVLARGLAPSPSARFPSMTALLGALDGFTARTRRLRGAWISAAVAAVIAALAFVLWPAGPRPCARSASAVEGVWDSPRRDSVRRAFLDTKQPYAKDAWRFFDEALRRYSNRWAAARRRACEQALERAAPAPGPSAASQCLDGRLAEMKALVSTFAQPDAKLVRRAPLAARRLSAINSCGARGRSPNPLPSDPALRTKVGALRKDLARLRALSLAGKYKEELRSARRVLGAAQELGYRPVVAEAWLRRGFAENHLGKAQDAAKSLRKAALLASSVRHDRVATRAWANLAHVAGVQLARRREGDRAAQHALAGAERLGNQPLIRARVLVEIAALNDRFARRKAALANGLEAVAIFRKVLPSPHPDLAAALGDLAVTHAKNGKLDESLALFEESHRQWTQLVGKDHPALVRSLGSLGNIWIVRGKLDRAERYLRQALALARRALPKDHPRLIDQLNNLGVTFHRAQRFEESLKFFRETLAIRKRKLGPDHPQTVDAASNAAAVLIELGRPREALPLLEHATRAQEKRLGPDHLQLAVALTNLATGLAKLGRTKESLKASARALKIKTKAHGPAHYSLAPTLHAIGHTLEQEKRFDEARNYHQRALAVRRKALGPSHRSVARSLLRLAKSWLAAAKPRRALPILERCVALYRKGKTSGPALSDALFAIARARWHQPASRRRAVADAKRALALLKKRTNLRKRIQRWLGRHRL